MNSHSIDLESSSSQYLDEVHQGRLNGADYGSETTIEAWVKLETLDVGGVIYYDWDWNPWKYIKLSISGTNKIYGLRKGSTNSGITGNTSLSIDTWHHVAMTCKNGQPTKVYLDAVLDGTAETNLSSPNTSSSSYNGIYIGASNYHGSMGNYFDGLIDEVRIWNKARTVSEIENNYQKELNGNEANLIAYWKLNNSLLDETANDNDLVNNNSATFSSDVPFGGAVGRSFAQII